MQKYSISFRKYICVYMHMSVYFHIMWTCYLFKDWKKMKKNLLKFPQDTCQFNETHFKKHNGKNTNANMVFKNFSPP